MAKSQIRPLVSEQAASQSVQFRHFGVLDDGKRSKGSVFTSVSVNILLAIIVCILGAAAKKTIANRKLIEISLAPQPKPEPPKPPKHIIKPPKPEEIVKMEPPKIHIPDVKLPDLPKPPDIKMPTPIPVVLPPAPKKVIAPAAPTVINLKPAAAFVANNDAHPSAIRLGAADNPIKSGPAVSAVNLGQTGAPGMNAANTGLGPHAVNVGSGSPNSTTTTGNGVRPVTGVSTGVVGGTGTARAAGPVNLGASMAPPPPQQQAVQHPAATGSAPKVVYKPKPEYTAEATANHIEGDIQVKIHVSASGAVQIIGLVNDLGYGLGNSAMRAVQGMRFQPATDVSGRPVDWDGIVKVNFQIAG